MRTAYFHAFILSSSFKSRTMALRFWELPSLNMKAIIQSKTHNERDQMFHWHDRLHLQGVHAVFPTLGNGDDVQLMEDMGLGVVVVHDLLHDASPDGNLESGLIESYALR